MSRFPGMPKFSQWFSDVSFCPYCYWYHFCFYISPMHFHYKVLIFQSIFGFYLDHNSLYWNFEKAVSINGHVACSLSPIIISGLLLGMFQSVVNCWFQNIFTLLIWLTNTDFVTCCCRFSLFNFTIINLLTLTCIWEYTELYLFIYFYFTIIMHAAIMWYVVRTRNAPKNSLYYNVKFLP
jgi:hypothetical protein